MEIILSRTVVCITKFTNNNFQKLEWSKKLKALHAYFKLFIQRATCSVVFIQMEGRKQLISALVHFSNKMNQVTSWHLCNGYGFQHLNGGLTLFIELQYACITSKPFLPTLPPYVYSLSAHVFPSEGNLLSLEYLGWMGVSFSVQSRQLCI